MNVVILDDEVASIEILQSYCDKIPSIIQVSGFRESVAALDYIKSHSVDLLISDINMPHISGVELQQLLPKKIATIFITAHAEYAVEAFELNALDYLLKPVSFVRFLKAIEKLTPIEKTVNQDNPSFLFVKIDGIKKRLTIADILYVEAYGDYLKVFTKGAVSPSIVLSTLTNFSQSLPSTEFVRVHRSFIVNLAHVDLIDTDHLIVGTTDITIGKTYRRAIEDKLKTK